MIPILCIVHEGTAGNRRSEMPYDRDEDQDVENLSK